MTTDTLPATRGLVTSLSWIPSEAIEGAQRLAFDSGITHYDPPPPSEDMDVEAPPGRRPLPLRQRAAGLRSTSTRGTDRRLRLRRAAGSWGPRPSASAGSGTASRPSSCRTSNASPSSGTDGSASCRPRGGRTGLPAPRRVRRRPFIQWQAPLVWTTLSLTLHADGRVGARARSGPAASPGTGSTTPTTALAQVGADRLQGLVPPVLRTAHPVGRPGLRGARDRGGDRRSRRSLSARSWVERKVSSSASPPAPSCEARASRAPRSSSSSTASSGSSTTANAWPSTGPARCSESGPTSKAAPAPRRSWRSPRAGWPSSRPTSWSARIFEELSEGHRREDQARY